jgi:galactokinase/mevalonate kinase-like predicted kinase
VEFPQQISVANAATGQGSPGGFLMIMVRYQGRIESLRLVEEFEDHVMHTAMALGGTITLFRRSIRESPGRIVP